MSTKVAHLKVGTLVTLLGLALGSSAALTAEAPSGRQPPLTKEQREKMATIHEQMATCLRSDKPIADCHKDAMKSCQDVMGKDGCPMMDGMGGMHGMRDHRMRNQSPK